LPGSNPQIDSWRSSRLTQQLYEHMRLYGYAAMDLPIIEAADLFLIKAGDQVVNRLFTFERHGQQLALRPEFTAPAAYRYISEPHPQQVVRWQFSGYIFEDDPNNFQSNHQRLSIGAELIGLSDPVADAEIISMAAQGLRQQSLSGWQITLGHIGLLRQMLARFQIDNRVQRFLLNHISSLKTPELGKAFVLEQLEKLLLANNSPTTRPSILMDETTVLGETDTQQMVDVMLDTTYRGNTMGGRTRDDIARRLSQKRQRYIERDHITAALDFLQQLSEIAGPPQAAFAQISSLISSVDTASQDLLTNWKRLMDLLNVYGITDQEVQIQPILARSWDYYSGVIFELRDQFGVHLGGGGRYDGLARLIGGQETIPAVGFAYYADDLLKVLPETFQPQPETVTVVFDNHSALAASRWAEVLRGQAIAVQLLPDTQNVRPDVDSLYPQADMNITFNDQIFTFDQLDALSRLLKGRR
jgi:histidyl-tRNA synthetase